MYKKYCPICKKIRKHKDLDNDCEVCHYTWDCLKEKEKMKVNVPCPNDKCETGFLNDYGDEFYCSECKKTFKFVELEKNQEDFTDVKK